MNHFFLYLDRDSWLHRLDGRTKVLALSGLFVIALVLSDPVYLAVATACTVLAMATAGALPNLRRVWPLLVLLWLYCLILWPLFVTGNTPFLTVLGLPVSLEAVQFGLAMGFRLDLMLLDGLLLLSTTTIEEFAVSLERLGLPGPVGFALSLAFRWVPSLIGSAGQIVLAQRSRGLDLAAGSWLARLRRYPPLAVPLIGHTLRQTRLLAMALEAKGYSPTRRRPPLLESRLRPADYATLFVVAALLGASVWFTMRGYGTVVVRF